MVRFIYVIEGQGKYRCQMYMSFGNRYMKNKTLNKLVHV